VPTDLSVHVPTVRTPRDVRLPAVWRPNDVEALLAAVDRSSPKGERDYAMLLLACRLGLRVSDIRTLRLEHLHWHVAELRLTQSKTEVPLTVVDCN
jgi:integrase